MNAAAHKTAEFYATGPADVRQLFAMFDWLGWAPGTMLDPCAGGAKGHGMPYPTVATEHGFVVDAMDIRDDSPAETIGNFLTGDLPPGRDRWDYLVSNPPFSLYRGFVERGLEVAGTVVLLLPLQVTEPRKTSWIEDLTWWRNHRPTWCFEHGRLSFSGSKQTAFQQYGHFVWTAPIKGEKPGYTAHLSVHDCDDLAEQGALL